MPRPPDTVLTPAFVALTLSDLAYFTAGGVLLGVTPFWVVGPLGAGPTAVGVAVGAFSVSALLLRPLAGRWVDRSGRRPLLVGGTAVFTVLVLGHLLVTDPVALVVLRLLLGCAEAVYVVAGFAALADLAPPGRAGQALSYNSLALFLGLAAGPSIGQGLLVLGGFGWVWVGTALLSALATALAARVPETHRRTTGPVPRTPLIHRAAVLPGLALCTGVAAVSGFLAFAPLHADRVGLELWSAVVAVFGVVVVACRLLFASTADRRPPIRLAGVALVTSTTGLALAAAVPSATGLLGGAALLGVGTAFLTPAVFAAVFGRVPPAERGSAAGTASAFLDLGYSGGPLVLGFVVAASSIPAAFLAGAALSAAGAVLALSRSVPGARRPAT